MIWLLRWWCFSRPLLSRGEAIHVFLYKIMKCLFALLVVIWSQVAAVPRAEPYSLTKPPFLGFARCGTGGGYLWLSPGCVIHLLSYSESLSCRRRRAVPYGASLEHVILSNEGSRRQAGVGGCFGDTNELPMTPIRWQQVELAAFLWRK